jgi:hypothetical protein
VTQWRIIVAVLAGPFMCLGFSARSQAQISPGPLARVHQPYSRPTQCVYCHRLATGSQNLRCLDCHTEIARRLAARLGFHAAVVNPQAGGKDCARCHSEHNGENFQLIRWEPSQKDFDHSKTGCVLEGKHAGLACKQCHNPAHIAPAERPNIKVKDLNRTFLGLSRDCISCHADRHRGQLGRDCARCHTVNDWKNTSQFNHSKTRYPLTGEHARVACQRCHKPEEGNAAVVKYVGLVFDKCLACHTDPHRGVFKASCESCHTTAGWKQVSASNVSARFDHSTTKYPLLGKHVGVRCEACHLGGDFNRPVAFQKCLDCHKSDPHHGQFNARKDGGDCAACHTVEGFKPTTFGVTEHASTAYPLEGKHAPVACAKCHFPKGLETFYRIRSTQCKDCHADAHKGQFAGAPVNNRCEACHSVKGFKPSSYTLAQHNTTRFPLTGGHIAVPCVECHKVGVLTVGSPVVPYHFSDLSCTTCHVDPHRGEFAARMKERRADGTPRGCEACHSTASWTEALRFDHSTTSFPLTGSHRAVACMSCHKPPNLEVTMRNVVYSSAPKLCEGCHEDPHAKQFAKDGMNPGCADCHNTARWKPSLFDHETRTDFPLKGAHQSVSCRDCHKLIRDVQNKPVLFYRPTPRECAACHGANVPEPKKTT